MRQKSSKIKPLVKAYKLDLTIFDEYRRQLIGIWPCCTNSTTVDPGRDLAWAVAAWTMDPNAKTVLFHFEKGLSVNDRGSYEYMSKPNNPLARS